MRKRSRSPSRMRGPGDADFAGGTCSQIPTGAIYSSGPVGLGGRCPSSSPTSLLPRPLPPGWNMKVEIFIEDE